MDRGLGPGISEAVGTGKVTVSVDVAPVVPGVIVGGLNAAVAPAGKPVADNVTTPLKPPPSGGIVMVALAGMPGTAEIPPTGALTPNEVTETETMAVAEV
jgi:hypothetical protein